MKIALDAMGGDNAPFETIKGAVSSLKEVDELELLLVGKKDIIGSELAKYTYDKSRVQIIDASEVILMTDEPVNAVRTKKNSSMNKALEAVKNGLADASVSAGNTGALIAASQLILKRIRGVLRPAIATIFPKRVNERLLLLDAGATSDCKPEYLEQYAVMGSKYMEIIFGKKNPKVGLLNIGTEEGKGNELVRSAYEMIRANKTINFVGNIESTGYLNSDIDVVVADGFTGNMVLKTSEGIVKFVSNILKSEVKKSLRGKIGGFLLLPIIKEMKRNMDSSEYGGAIFLGLNGISIKAHGNSDYVAIKNAIKVAHKFAKMKFIDELKGVINIAKEKSSEQEVQ